MNQAQKKGTARQTIFLGFLLATVIVGAGCYWMYWKVTDFVTTMQESKDWDTPVETIQKVVNLLTEAEGDIFAYVITQDTAALAPYKEILYALEDLQISEVVDANPDITEPMQVLEELIGEKFLLENRLINVVGDTNIKSPYELVYEEFEEAIRLFPTRPPPKNPRKRRPSPQKKPKPSPKQNQAESSPKEQKDTSEEIKPDYKRKFHIFGIGLNKEEREARKQYKNKKREEQKKKKEPRSARRKLKRKDKSDIGGITEVADILIPKSPIPTDTDQKTLPRDPQKLMKILRDSIEQRKSLNEQLVQEQQDSILQYVKLDRALMQEIVSILRNVEQQEAEKLATKAQDASRQAEQMPVLIAIFAAVVLFLFIILLFIIFRDIARNQRLNQQLEAETTRAHKLAHAKEEFLANMSHDIRTPMNAIIGFADQLKDTPMNTQQHKFLRTIRHSGKYLLDLINDVLDYSKLEAGNFQLELTNFHPREVLTEVYETFKGQAEKKGLILNKQQDHALPQVLLGDPLRLKQMLFNLTNNAIKFTDKGSVTINCKVLSNQKEQVLLAFSVSDTGIGIAKDKLNTIFQEYGQAEQHTARKFGGTGLGLSIARKLAEKHGGSIEVKSQLNKGTVFTILIPYEIGNIKQANKTTTTGKVDPAFLKGKRFLLADDEPFNRFLLETIMEKWGVKADSVENGRKVVEQVRKNKYDFILIDLQMPEMSGMEATRHIRQQLNQQMPIIALTATSTPSEVEESLKSGINDVLLKPFKEQALLKKLLAITEDKHEPSIVQAIFNDMPRYQIDELYKLTGNNKSKVLHLLEIFAKHTPAELRMLQKAVKAKDWKMLSNAAHKLIPKVRHLVPAMESRLRFIKEQADSGQSLNQLPAVVKEVTRQLIEIIVEVEKDVQKLKKER